MRGEALSSEMACVMDGCQEAILNGSLCTCAIRGVPCLVPISNFQHSESGDS